MKFFMIMEPISHLIKAKEEINSKGQENAMLKQESKKEYETKAKIKKPAALV